MAADLAALVLEAPAADVGTPTGVGDWRYVVQVLLPQHPRSVVGAFRVGIDVVSADVWTDMRDYVTGVRITGGGSDFGDHHSPLQLDVTFDSPDGRLAPFGPIGADGSGHRFTKGCPIRVVLFDPVADVWVPRFTGEIETAEPVDSGNGSVQTLAVTALDPVHSRLAKVDLLDHTIGSSTEGVPVVDELAALLEFAGFPYGSVIDVPIDDGGGYEQPFCPLGEVAVSGNLLDTFRRVADALGAKVAADRFGRLLIVRRRPALLDPYSNAYTPAVDPNAPSPVVLDTALLPPDSVKVQPAGDAIVNAFEAKDLLQSGIWGPAVIGEDTAPVRASSLADSTLARGLQSATSQSVLEPFTAFFRFTEIDVLDGTSRDRFGLHRRSLGQVFPLIASTEVEALGGGGTSVSVGEGTLNLFELIAARLLELQADGHQLWRITGVQLDDLSQMDVISTVAVGSAATVHHDGATFEGFVADISESWQPLDTDAALLQVTVGVDCYSIERAPLL